MLIGLSMSFFSSCSQNRSELDGKWVSMRVELKNGDTGEKYTLDGKPYNVGDTLVFHNGKIYEPKFQITSPYQLTENMLRLGNRKFIVEKISQRELVLLENDDPYNLLPFRTYYVKIAN